MACVCTVAEIEEFCGGVNAPGLDRMLSITCSDQVATIPAATAHVISTAITMTASPAGVFFKWFFSKEDSTWSSERDENGMWNTEVKIFVSQLAAEKTTVFNGLTGDNMIAIVTDRNGKKRLVGDITNGASVKVKETSSPKSGYEVTITWQSAYAPYFYTSTITY